jgi:hypothetical protein
MKKDNSELDDELLPEYHLKSLRVRKLGSGRKSFGRNQMWRRCCPVPMMSMRRYDLIQISQRQPGKNTVTQIE